MLTGEGLYLQKILKSMGGFSIRYFGGILILPLALAGKVPLFIYMYIYIHIYVGYTRHPVTVTVSH